MHARSSDNTHGIYNPLYTKKNLGQSHEKTVVKNTQDQGVFRFK